jgi:phosphoribosylformylglycinamidine synthase
MIVAEAAANLACVGARPIALVNCLNFGNPEHPAVMWQLSESIDGMAEACRALDVPVVGGNVSLYNETAGRDIDPTPVVGMLGLVDNLDRRPAGARVEPGCNIGCIGPPVLDLAVHARVLDVVRGLVADDLVVGVHDVADGGLALCVAEMAIASECGVEVRAASSDVDFFDETPSRIVVAVTEADIAAVVDRCRAADVPVKWIGAGGGDRIVIGESIDVALATARARWASRLPAAFGTAVTH